MEEGQNKRRCWYHGRDVGCRNGAQCAFSHEGPLPENISPSKERVQRRWHDEQRRKRRARWQPRVGAPLCHFFVTTGCAYGDACAYGHSQRVAQV